MIIYLYVKTHNKTGLKYLGKTTRDPYTYNGSGKDWIPHLKEHGVDIRTDIVKECLSNDELSYWGRHYSALWNVVNSQDDFGNKIWANRIPETGGGGIGLNAGSDFNKGENNPMYGGSRPDLSGPTSPNKTVERREENSIKSKLMWCDEEFKEKMKVNRKEKWQEPEYLEKMKNRPKTVKKVTIYEKEYNSLKEAAMDLGLDPSTVSKRCSSKHKQFIEWKYT